MKNKKPVYIRCPRCELNYIQKKQNYCDICKAEMRLIDPNILIPEEEEEEIICPVCKVNYMSSEEEMCFLCAKEVSEKYKAAEVDEWAALDAKADPDIVDDTELEIPLSALEEEDDIIESFDDEGPAPDDFDYVTVDELGDDVYDEEEEEDDEEEDF